MPPSFKAGKGEDNFSMRNIADEAYFPLDYLFFTSAPSLAIISTYPIVSLFSVSPGFSQPTGRVANYIIRMKELY